VASFSNGDAPLTLTSLGDGRWAGTWQAQNSAASVSVTVKAQSVDQTLSGSTQVAGTLQQNANPPPVVASEGVLNAASYALKSSLAPGALISVFGSLLSQTTASASALPLPIVLGQTSLSIAGRKLPLLFSGPTQLNALIPYDLPFNATHQVVVQRGTAISVPEPIGVLASQSGVFTKDLSGQGLGIIVKVASDGTQSIVGTENPAHAYEAIVIYCSGLGDVNPRQVSGAAASSAPVASVLDAPTVTIGGLDAPVFFAGLTPGFAGLYQVNAYVPSGVVPGNSVPLVITQSGRSSPAVAIAVQ